MKEDVVEIKKKTYYGDTANDYDKIRLENFFGRTVDKLEKSAILRLLKKIHCKNILDLPCGTGRITQFLLEHNYFVTGVDVSKDMIKLSKEKLSKYKNLNGLVVSSGDTLPFKDNTFEMTTSIRLMGHLPSEYRLKVIHEINRVSNSIIVSYHTKNSLMGFLKYLKIKHKKHDKNWFQVKEKDAIKELEKCGFKVIRKSYVFPGIAETYFLLGKK